MDNQITIHLRLTDDLARFLEVKPNLRLNIRDEEGAPEQGCFEVGYKRWDDDQPWSSRDVVRFIEKEDWPVLKELAVLTPLWICVDMLKSGLL